MSVKTKENKSIELLEDENERIRLIAEYEARPWMWDFSHVDWKDKQKKFTTLNEIAGLMSTEDRAITGLSVKIVK